MESKNTGKGSVSPDVHPHTLLHDGWMGFLHIGYHDQVPWVADAFKIEIGIVSNFSNYGHYMHFVMNLVCFL